MAATEIKNLESIASKVEAAIDVMKEEGSAEDILSKESYKIAGGIYEKFEKINEKQYRFDVELNPNKQNWDFYAWRMLNDGTKLQAYGTSEEKFDDATLKLVQEAAMTALKRKS
ncbi:MAG TPA: hypothetical protein VJ110_02440 [Candidatus Nanoarchaeia archaeon]|nr:hypothetical protein [Candidatus Nanoarchaeia archaeon]